MNVSKHNVIATSFILVAAALSLFGGIACINKSSQEEFVPNANVRFTPSLTLKICDKYGDTSEIERCEVVFSKTPDMEKSFKRFRLYKNDTVKLEEYSGGEVFYIGAFIDADGNLAPTYGTDPIAGAYAASYDEKSVGRIEIKKDAATHFEIKMIRPIHGRSPADRFMGTTSRPKFSWTRPDGIEKFEISVSNNETAFLYWKAVSYSSEITYGIINYYKDIELVNNAVVLPANSKHNWSLRGFDKNGEVWAYAPQIDFLP